MTRKTLFVAVSSLFVLSTVTSSALADDVDVKQDEGPPASRALPNPVVYAPAPEPSDQTVLGTKVDHGGYGAPEMKLTSMAGSPALLVGAQGGWIIAHRLVLGGAGYGLTTDVASPTVIQPTNGGAKLSFAYGGFKIGAILAPRSIVHPTISMLVGGGSVRSATSAGLASRSDTFFTIEPEVALEINVARNIRLATAVTYRLIGGTDVFGLTPSELSGVSGGLALKFGSF